MIQRLLYSVPLLFILTFLVHIQTADAFNGVGGGGTTETSTGTSSSSGQAVGNIISGVGVDSQASQKAATMLSPFVSMFNTGVALVLGIIILAMIAITIADLMYIMIPMTRSMFAGKRQIVSDEALHIVGAQPQQDSGGMGGGFGGGGFGGSSGGFGGGFGGSSGGFGGGGFGGGGFGGDQQQEESPKNKLISYTKARVINLVILGILLVLFSTTIFTDIGIKIGGWLMEKLIGVEQSINLITPFL